MGKKERWSGRIAGSTVIIVGLRKNLTSIKFYFFTPTQERQAGSLGELLAGGQALVLCNKTALG